MTRNCWRPERIYDREVLKNTEAAVIEDAALEYAMVTNLIKGRFRDTFKEIIGLR